MDQIRKIDYTRDRIIRQPTLVYGYEDLINLYPADNTCLPVQVGLVTDVASHKMPSAYMTVLAERGCCRPYVTAAFHISNFVNLSKTIYRFYEFDLLGQNFAIGLRSYMKFTNGGRRNQNIIIKFYVAAVNTTLTFTLDRKMQGQFLQKYRSMYDHVTTILRWLNDDDIEIF